MSYTPIPNTGSSSGGGGGGGGTTVSPLWQSAMEAYVKSQVSAVGASAVFVNFVRTSEFTAGSGTVNLSSAFNNGVAQCHPGIGVSMLLDPVGNPFLLSGIKATRWAAYGRMAFQGPITVNTTLHMGAFVNSHNGFAALSLTPGGGGIVNWALTTYDGTAAIVLPTTTPFPALSTFFDWALMYDTTTLRAAVGQVETTGMVAIAETQSNLTRMPIAAGGVAMNMVSSAVDDPFFLLDSLGMSVELPA